jgi:hypothetical protein
MPQSAAVPGSALSPDAERLWEPSVSRRLKGDRWANAGRYDAAHVLMLPLHAAFLRHYERGEWQFTDHVERFFARRTDVQFVPANELSWLQYLYLISQFLVLAAKHGHPALVPDGLPSQMRSWVDELWRVQPAWHWTHGPFDGMGERIRWKLASGRPGGDRGRSPQLRPPRWLAARRRSLARHHRRGGAGRLPPAGRVAPRRGMDVPTGAMAGSPATIVTPAATPRRRASEPAS